MSCFTDIRTPLIPPGPAAPAHYLGWVNYPEEPKRRERFIAATQGLMLKREGLPPKDQPDDLQRAAPGQPKDLTPIVQPGEGRLMRYRLRAAYNALHMLSARPDSGDRIAGPDSFAGADARWLSLSHDVEPPYSVDPRDARKEIWKPSRPVLPMATTLLYEPETLAELLRQCRAGLLLNTITGEIEHEFFNTRDGADLSRIGDQHTVVIDDEASPYDGMSLRAYRGICDEVKRQRNAMRERWVKENAQKPVDERESTANIAARAGHYKLSEWPPAWLKGAKNYKASHKDAAATG